MKSYTDLEQSKKLAEILPIESADYHYIDVVGYPERLRFYPYATSNRSNEDLLFIPCWSLAALLGVLEHPRCFQGDKPIYWFCGCFGKDNLYHEVEADNPIDACVTMIEKLNELKML